MNPEGRAEKTRPARQKLAVIVSRALATPWVAGARRALAGAEAQAEGSRKGSATLERKPSR